MPAFTSTPYSSGGIDREQGIGKAGNRRLRTVTVELAWLRQRYQLGAALWLGSAIASAQPAAVFARLWWWLSHARLIALWRFVIDGVMPEGAVMKPPSNRRPEPGSTATALQSGDPRERRRSSAWRLASS